MVILMVLNLFLAVLSGLLVAFSFPVSLPPFIEKTSFPTLLFLGLVPSLLALKRTYLSRQAWLIGFFFGIFFAYVSLYWISDFGQFPLILLSVYLGFWYGILFIFLGIMIRCGSDSVILFIVPLVWTAGEFVSSYGASGFPWLRLAHPLFENKPLLQLASVGGELLISYFVLLANTAIFVLFFGKSAFAQRVKAVSLSLAFLGALYIWGGYAYGQYLRFERILPTLEVTGIQGGVSSFTQWSARGYYLETKEAYVNSTLEAIRKEPTSSVYVWPESAIPVAYSLEFPEPIEDIKPIWKEKPDAVLLQGTFFEDADGNLFNGAMVTDGKTNQSFTYSKPKPVPYGEFVPLAGIARFLNYPWGEKDINPGKVLTPMPVNREMAGVGICFDNIFPSVSRAQVRKGASFLTVLANNSWYKMPAGVIQHRAIDYFRAVENRRALVRVATTGNSHVILPSGRLAAETRLGERTYLTYAVPVNHRFSLYTRVGELVGTLTFLVSSLFVCVFALKGVSEEIF